MTDILTRLAALTSTDGNGLLPCPFRGNPDYTIRYQRRQSIHARPAASRYDPDLRVRVIGDFCCITSPPDGDLNGKTQHPNLHPLCNFVSPQNGLSTRSLQHIR